MAQNTRKPFGGWVSAPDPGEGAYSSPANTLAGGDGLAVPSPRTPSPLSALRASPLLPHWKISADAVAHAVKLRNTVALCSTCTLRGNERVPGSNGVLLRVNLGEPPPETHNSYSAPGITVTVAVALISSNYFPAFTANHS